MANRIVSLAAAFAFGGLVLQGAAFAASAQTERSKDAVQVEFQRPEQFTDAAERNPADDQARTFFLEQLARYLAARAAPLLRPGQRLSIVITDVDRAGAYEPWRRKLGDVRIVRNVYPVRIDLAFRLEDGNGVVLEQGERKLRDSYFLDRWHTPNDPLRYEKALLDDWLERELGKRPA